MQSRPEEPAHLWLLPEDAVDRFAARLGGTGRLTPAEQAGLRRRLTPGAQRRFLGARLLSRHALSARTGRDPGDWRFTSGVHGRPEPDDDTVRFNLSHTEGLIACVVTDGGGCGVDAGPGTAPAGLLSAVDRLLAPAERAEFDAAPVHRRAGLLGELWALKESYLKALGTGLIRDPREISFRARPGGGHAVLDPQHPAGHWWFDLLRRPGGHVVAVATERGGPGRLRVTELGGPYRPSGSPSYRPSGSPCPATAGDLAARALAGVPPAATPLV